MTYDGFDTMPIAGQWRVGRLGETADDVDPWSDDVLVRLPLANADDADAAFRGAADAQPDWAATLPGNGPVLILDDADLEAAVDAATFGSLFHQGQICMATNRVVVADAVYDEVVDRLTERVRSLVTGDPRDPATQIGPIIDDDQLGHVLDLVERAEKDGADVRVRGERSGPAGRVLGPHLLLGTNDVATAAEEVFGPVATVIRARDDDDAVRIANDTEYGLSSAVFSRDVERAVRVGLRIDAGMTHVNDTTVNDEPNTAFGGEKGSGIGRFGGEWAIDEFTTDHWIGVQRTRRDYAI